MQLWPSSLQPSSMPAWATPTIVVALLKSIRGYQINQLLSIKLIVIIR